MSQRAELYTHKQNQQGIRSKSGEPQMLYTSRREPTTAFPFGKVLNNQIPNAFPCQYQNQEHRILSTRKQQPDISCQDNQPALDLTSPQPSPSLQTPNKDRSNKQQAEETKPIKKLSRRAVNVIRLKELHPPSVLHVTPWLGIPF
ncbi:hypothetical protein Dimus_021819 [Dionaea muscipula]